MKGLCLIKCYLTFRIPNMTIFEKYFQCNISSSIRLLISEEWSTMYLSSENKNHLTFWGRRVCNLVPDFMNFSSKKRYNTPRYTKCRHVFPSVFGMNYSEKAVRNCHWNSLYLLWRQVYKGGGEERKGQSSAQWARKFKKVQTKKTREIK